MTTEKAKTSKAENEKRQHNKLARVIRMNKKRIASLQQQAHTAWAFANAALWNGQQFSVQEAAVAKIQIGMHLAGCPSPENALSIFCQRIMLARLYRLSVQPLPYPSVWFAPDNEEGYTATEAMYTELDNHRQSIPATMPGLLFLGHAVKSFSKRPSGEQYRAIRDQFNFLKEPQLAQVFQVFTANRAYDF